MESPQKLKLLFDKYLDDKASALETKTLMDYYGTEDEAYLSDLILAEFERDDKLILLALPEHIYEGISRRISIPKKKRIFPLWHKIAASICIVFFMGLGSYYWLSNKYTDEQKEKAFAVIKPGRVGATLTLSDGRKIYLADVSEGELVKEAGIKITKNPDGSLIYTVLAKAGTEYKENTISTAKGETQALILSDGTRVWLNASSSLSYLSSFEAAMQRRVRLTGEAYFEVAKDAKRPFIVSSILQDVEVLGTHFNVDGYQDDGNIRTTLLEGSVMVTQGSSKISQNLKPGQQSVLSPQGIKVVNVETDDVVAWKEGYFMFSSENLASIMKELSRWYQVDVKFENEELKNKTFFGSVTRFSNIGKVLQMLEATGKVRFEIKDRTVYVKNK